MKNWPTCEVLTDIPSSDQRKTLFLQKHSSISFLNSRLLQEVIASPSSWAETPKIHVTYFLLVSFIFPMIIVKIRRLNKSKSPIILFAAWCFTVLDVQKVLLVKFKNELTVTLGFSWSLTNKLCIHLYQTMFTPFLETVFWRFHVLCPRFTKMTQCKMSTLFSFLSIQLFESFLRLRASLKSRLFCSITSLCPLETLELLLFPIQCMETWAY